MAEDQPEIPSPPKGLPDGGEFMRPGPNGDLWFVPSFGQYGAVYVAASDGVRLAGGKDLDTVSLTHDKGGSMPTAEKQAQAAEVEAETTEDQPEAVEPEAAPKPKRTKKASPLKVALAGSDAELREFLLVHTTVADKMWAERAGRKSRRGGESRADFIVRVLGEEG